MCARAKQINNNCRGCSPEHFACRSPQERLLIMKKRKLCSLHQTWRIFMKHCTNISRTCEAKLFSLFLYIITRSSNIKFIFHEYS